MRRRGVSLLEVLLALAIASVPLVIALTLIHRNATQARLAGDRVVGRLVLMDLMEVLLAEEVDRLKEIAADPGKLEALIKARIAKLPPFAQAPYEDRVLPLARQARLILEERPAGAAPGLVRLTLELRIEDGVKAGLEIRQLVRPAARDLPVSLK